MVAGGKQEIQELTMEKAAIFIVEDEAIVWLTSKRP